jgi:pellino protein
VAAQMSLLAFRTFSGRCNGPADLFKPNIRATNGCGPDYLDPNAFAVFRSLGLIIDGSWTEAAETVLWRKYPEVFPIDFTLDGRFLSALELAVATVPADVATAIEDAVTISERDIDDWLGSPKRHRNGPKTRKDAVKVLQYGAQRELYDIFVRRWRLSDGWLLAEEAKRGLSIQLDPLATHMCVAFASMFLPHLPFLFDY